MSYFTVLFMKISHLYYYVQEAYLSAYQNLKLKLTFARTMWHSFKKTIADPAWCRLVVCL